VRRALKKQGLTLSKVRRRPAFSFRPLLLARGRHGCTRHLVLLARRTGARSGAGFWPAGRRLQSL